MTMYRCGDMTCGAYDCSSCYPGNDNELEHNEAKEEYEAEKGDRMRDEEKDERYGG